MERQTQQLIKYFIGKLIFNPMRKTGVPREKTKMKSNKIHILEIIHLFML